jgi:predicted transcriptional regulator
MRKDYEEFAKRYRESGLSKKEFGLREGVSASMVTYYLKKAQPMKNDVGLFREIEVVRPGASTGCIKITTSSGLTIEIPL